MIGMRCAILRRLKFRRRSSVVERALGKGEVGCSILPGGTSFPQDKTISGATAGRRLLPAALHVLS